MDIIIDKNSPHAMPDIPGRFYENLLLGMGYTAQNMPVGDLLRQYHHLEGQWLVVSPITWQATHNDAVIQAPTAEAALSEDEARSYYDAFAEFASHDGLTTHFHDQSIWLIECTQRPAIQTKSLHDMIGLSMLPELQTMDATLYWQRFLTEVQMLFSGHAQNKHRRTMPINGVWLWGSGVLEKPTNRTIFSQEKYAPWARLLSTNVTQSTASIREHSMLLLADDLVCHERDIHRVMNRSKVCWYWNNTSYVTKPKFWLFRLWSHLCK